MTKEMYYVAMWGSLACSTASENLMMSVIWLVCAIFYGVMAIKKVGDQ